MESSIEGSFYIRKFKSNLEIDFMFLIFIYKSTFIRHMIMKKKLRVVDMFCWCWWLSYGFEMAWFDVVAWVDNFQEALSVFEKNHKGSKWLNLDLFDDKSLDTIVEECWPEKIDVIIWWPPCQWFSLTWTRDENDKRNKLFYSMFNLAKKLNPSVILIENVPWLATLYDWKAKDAIIEQFESLWYNYKYQVLYAPDYWVPQIRKRLIFVWYKKWMGEFEFPKPIYNEESYVSCSDAISDLHDFDWDDLWSDVSEYKSKPLTPYQEMMRKWSEHLYNHVWTKHTENVINVISQVPDWWNYKDLPEWVWWSRIFREAWTRYNSKKPSKTIDTWHRNHFHYKYNRIPTVRENARLQSFPDTFVFEWNKTKQYKMVWNAVPPLLGYNLAKQIKKLFK